jgi:hypothetical protein
MTLAISKSASIPLCEEGPACQDRGGFRKHIDPALTSRALLRQALKIADCFSSPFACH